MRITKVEWQNFTSYGNRKQELDLSNETSLFQIVGENGAGKTSISQVITFALYGKVEGKKLKDIPNRINGNAWTKVTLDNYGTEVVVERGLDPNLFKLIVNGTEYDKAGSRSIQEYLEEDIIGIPYYVFNNTLLLSINDFKSFIKMSPSDKRAIVDKIFGFHILNQMRDVLKVESRKMRQVIDTTIGKISSLETSIQNSYTEMESLSDEIQKQNLDKLDELKTALKKFGSLRDHHKILVADFKKEEDTLSDALKESNLVVSSYNLQIRDLTKKLHLYNHDKCPTCETNLKSDFHEGLKKELESEKNKLEKRLKESELVLTKYQEDSKLIAVKKSDLLEKGLKIKNKIEDFKIKIGELEGESQNNQTDALERLISNLQGDLDSMNSEKIKTEEKFSWLKTIDEILGEKGVKQMAIKTILPPLNSEIMDLLSKMHLDYRVIFDEEFNASIYHMGIEISSQTLSTGEMKKVDFVVLIAIMKLMKMKFSNINLLFLDELFSSVDPDGVYSILKILKSTCKELGLNIFVINHAPMPHEIFDWKMEIQKLNNFSSLSIDRF
jgi:DNA repair exonuclease SbcCD ATPase subunit